MLQAPQPPPTEAILTALLNEITTLPDNFVLVLDDYHVIDAKPVDQALTFLLEHLPPQMHLVIATREDPQLPLARLRARGQLTELRATDLRFTPAEAAGFLNQVMGLDLSAEDIAALETRTEGWIAGLQLAALSLQGHQDATSFIQSFTGSHRFVLDYLVEEVLQRQPAQVQTFLLRTSILDRLCGPLCDAVLLRRAAAVRASNPGISRTAPTCSSSPWTTSGAGTAITISSPICCASDCTRAAPRLQGMQGVAWPNYTVVPASGMKTMAWSSKPFSMRLAANDVERAERLIEGEGMPLHFRGAGAPVLNWLESLPTTVLDARPSLWVTYASALTDDRPTYRRRRETPGG